MSPRIQRIYFLRNLQKKFAIPPLVMMLYYKVHILLTWHNGNSLFYLLMVNFKSLTYPGKGTVFNNTSHSISSQVMLDFQPTKYLQPNSQSLTGEYSRLMDNPMPVGYIPPFSTKNLVSSLLCQADTVYSYEKYSAYNRKNLIKEKSVLIFQLDLTTVERNNFEELKLGKVRKDRINSRSQR